MQDLHLQLRAAIDAVFDTLNIAIPKYQPQLVLHVYDEHIDGCIQ